jgi:hypothetical protein
MFPEQMACRKKKQLYFRLPAIFDDWLDTVNHGRIHA